MAMPYVNLMMHEMAQMFGNTSAYSYVEVSWGDDSWWDRFDASNGSISNDISYRGFDELPTYNSPETLGVVDVTADPNQTLIDDAVRIANLVLNGNNECATFFWTGASEVLTILAGLLKPGNVAGAPPELGIQMSILKFELENTASGRDYMKPTNATVHTSGMFFNFAINIRPGVVSNTLEGRTLQILHELGHLLFKAGTSPFWGPTGNYLFANFQWDGGNSSRSKFNTMRVWAKCGVAIRNAISEASIKGHMKF